MLAIRGWPVLFLVFLGPNALPSDPKNVLPI